MGMPPPVEEATVVKTLLVYAPLVVLAVLVAGLYGAVYNQTSIRHQRTKAINRSTRERGR